MDLHGSPTQPTESSGGPVVATSSSLFLRAKDLVRNGYVASVQRLGQLSLAPRRIGAVLVAVLVLVSIFFILNNDEHVAVKQFTNVYSFVPEKVSKSAAVQLQLPAGVTEEIARTSIKFSPEIDGEWQVEDIPDALVFKPKKPLRTGVYYAVNLDTGTIQMSGDFFVDEDPKIEAIFPVAASEVNENTEITIVFNRPMVPLTTLATQESFELPITITPETPGRFKWISTRNLQFIPEETLVPASNYTVTIGDGFNSLDGLPVPPVTHTFFTRPLRYVGTPAEVVGYRSPMIVSFNQPVALDETADKVKVTRADGSDVSVVVEYGETSYFDREKQQLVTETDTSKLFIYQRKDKDGRSRVWDFDTTYTVALSGAVPLRGENELREGLNKSVNVPSIVQNVSAESDRTSLVRPALFDPEGTLIVTFYDDIDKDASQIDIKGLKSVAYGERCQALSSGESEFYNGVCIKEPDTKTLIFAFKPEVFTPGEAFEINLKKIITQDGFRANAEPIRYPLTVYPVFSILSTTPQDRAEAARLDGITVCSNTPLRAPEESGLSSYIQTDGYIVYGRWSNSYYIDYQNEYNECKTGEYETRIPYGLLPETDYALQLSLTDAFGQTDNRQLAVRTSPPLEQYTRFHNLQEQYNVTTPDKTRFTYAVENLEYVNLHICKLTPESFLQNIQYRYDSYTPPRNENCIEVKEQRIELPVRYFVNNYFQVNLADYFADTRGQYILTFSNPLYKNSYDKKQLYDRTYVSVTNLAVGKKEVEYSDERWSVSSNPSKDKVLTQQVGSSKNLYWVSHSTTLEPIIGATVTQYADTPGRSDETLVQRSSAVTDATGVASVTVDKDVAGAVIRVGAESAVVTDWADTLQWANTVEDASKTYIYTDRPIYRPGHTVHVRGIDRIGFDGKYEVWNKETVPFEVFDSEGKRIYETKLTESLYGTFATDFELALDASLGTYRIEVFGQSSYFDVEEYVPAAFKLEATTAAEEYISGDTLRVEVQADYYFGVPLDGGTVTYALTAQDYYFDRYTDEYFNFGSDWYYCYSCGYGDDFLFRGETTLGSDGSAVIERPLTLADYFSEDSDIGSKIVTLTVTAKDINGRSVSLQKSFIVHEGEFYLGGKTDKYYTAVNQANTLRIKTVDTTGAGVAVSDIEKVLYKVEWETFRRQEVDGGFYYRSEKRLTEINREKVKTDKDGNWSGDEALADEGQYEVQLRAVDDRKHVMTVTIPLYVYGREAVTVPPNNNYELELEVEKTNLSVGEKASVLIKSPYPRAKALVTIERGLVYEHEVIDVVGGLQTYEFTAQSAYAPNIYVSVLLLSPNPEIKYGSVYYNVGSTEHELTVRVESNKKVYLPGEEVTLEVSTTDHQGAGVPAEVSIAVADLSVLALKGNPKKNPHAYFYAGFPLAIATASNIKNILYEVDIPLGTKGGGGADPDDLATKKRGLFKDTAFWQATTLTNSEGRATVSFTLPDNLTTWQIESLGVTTDTKIGVSYQEFTTKKQLMAVPLKPRFVVPGDTFSLGATVFNETDAGVEVTLTLESPTLTLKDDGVATAYLAPGESKTIYFPVSAPADRRAGNHAFTVTATGSNLSDSVEQTIAITPNTAYETVATANATKMDRSVEYLYVPQAVIAEEGGLTINANATLAVFMTDALSYMVTYPYGCSEQLASALSTIGVMKSALSLPNVEGDFETIEYEGVTYTIDTVIADGLARLYEAQTIGGGFSYYSGLQPDLALTSHVVEALHDLKLAGYEVREDVLIRGAQYLESETARFYRQYPAEYQETVILTEYVLRRMAPNSDTALTDIVENLIEDDAFIAETISSQALAKLAILTAHDYGWLDRGRVYTAFENRINIDGRGAYLSSGVQLNYDFFETTIKNTALALSVFVAHEDEHETLPNMLRWLLASRDRDGVWGSTQDTFLVIRAMVEYLKWQHETESHFNLRAMLSGTELFNFEFNPNTVFTTFSHFVPMRDLATETLLPVVFDKEDKNGIENNLYYDMTLKYYLPVESLPPRDEGITITRDLYRYDGTDNTKIADVVVGDLVKGTLILTIPEAYRNVAVEDYIPAGFEIVNFNLSTEDQSLQSELEGQTEVPWWGYGEGSVSSALNFARGLWGGDQSAQIAGFSGYPQNQSRAIEALRPTHVESHDDRVFLYAEYLSPGVYRYEYFLRALVPGTFQHMPATARELYFPEIFGRTSGDTVTVIEAD